MHARFHHRQPFHRRMQILAALAIALLVLAPLVSRALLYATPAGASHAHTPAAHDRAMMDHSAHGQHGAHMSMHMHMDMHGSAATPAPAPSDPHAGHEMGVDCDYCAIAARMTTLVLAALWLLIAWIPPRRALSGLARTHAAPPPHAYAARGPPALAA
ncbi:DUF2946 family protein [Stenotrophomonas sp. 24(2023)]|uniref:DUF2946 family protein n=1 Tax=Stenotrophomonas sp. 24(2023) TaxID=3068324 RepID=UPI0027DFAA58|nr:DUF2946 family protein [Stenotrophomonas sp. 24(2023)]WMJ69362.1 DUF2946 domain-containing protein [Stenotrophomonas sp. 24(2023)]